MPGWRSGCPAVLSASEVARAAGLSLHRKGSREWACCPIHREKTPSMCFYPDGRWYCFGCHERGDAADLYKALHGGTIGEALRAVGKASLPEGGGSRKAAGGSSPGEQLRRKVEAHRAREWDAACAACHAANATIGESPDGPALWRALEAREKANRRLDWLQAATDSELLNDLAEVQKLDQLERTGSDTGRASRAATTLAPSGRASRPA